MMKRNTGNHLKFRAKRDFLNQITIFKQSICYETGYLIYNDFNKENMKLIFVLAVSILGLTQGSSVKNQRNRLSGCRSGWYRILDSCIWLSRDTRNHESANRECSRLDKKGKLFEPKNQLQNELVLTLVKHRQQKHKAWIGITDKQKEGKFTYGTSVDEIFYTNWAKGEPSKYNRDKNCVNFWPSWDQKEKQGQWADESCKEKFHYICEKALNEY